MALTDPQTITVNAVAKVMPRVSNNGLKSLYSLPDTTFFLDVVHEPFTRDKKRRIRSRAVFTQRAIVPDPLTSVNDWETQSVSVQIDRPEVGFSDTQVDQLVQGFKAWLTTAMVGQLYGRQS